MILTRDLHELGDDGEHEREVLYNQEKKEIKKRVNIPVRVPSSITLNLTGPKWIISPAVA